jgi:hypothetical protein
MNIVHEGEWLKPVKNYTQEDLFSSKMMEWPFLTSIVTVGFFLVVIVGSFLIITIIITPEILDRQCGFYKITIKSFLVVMINIENCQLKSIYMLNKIASKLKLCATKSEMLTIQWKFSSRYVPKHRALPNWGMRLHDINWEMSAIPMTSNNHIYVKTGWYTSIGHLKNA